ncbi:ACP S-malonyltransferase [Sciscionella marina]|uniref:ACP S-malonyltransferase n=1 Tax=Sciscionella marina TaxID=508770 RepID=UPI00037DFA93|nr:ACP S-malonyltransferase [Sciscionella marina]
MSPTALVFPGMAPNRFAELTKFLLLNRAARQRVTEADDAIGYSVLDAYADSTDDYGTAAQLAFLVSCVAIADELELRPDVLTGVSFGQKAAAVFSGALDFSDAVRLTAIQAACEQEYFAVQHQDVVTHTVMRVPEDGWRTVLGELSWYEISGVLDEGFHMISLHSGELDGFITRISEVGGYSLYTMRPPVHAPSFTALRNTAERSAFGDCPLRDPEIPVLADQDGSLVRTAEGIRGMLLDTFDRPIDWPQVTAALHRLEITDLHFCGTDNLFSRVPRTKEFRVRSNNPKLALRPRKETVVA